MIDTLRPASVACAIAALAHSLPAAAAGEWSPFDGGPDTTCADGSAVPFLERVADPTKVVLYFEGGGACFSQATCALDGPEVAYVSSSEVSAESLASRGGVFDFDDPENPLADHSFVYVPYCTGDVHLGDKAHVYADDLVIEHRGAVNANAALDHLVERFPDTSELIVVGVSAGSVPTPLYAALAADRLPQARVVTLGDGSGAYPDDPLLNAYIGTLWGSMAALPDWPELAGVTVRDWSIPGLYVHAGRHAPDVTFARFDHAYDETQVFYAGLVGVPADDLVRHIDRIETEIEAEGVPVASYTAPGNDHTVLWRDELYELEVEGVRLIDWVTALFEGETPADVHCVACR